MYIKEIKINGFKSFADRINIELDKTFTGIVGPNGSGKSNIVDAIKWVLGEQSVKTLRGSTVMTDIIFNGSKSRDAKNAASVSLVFDNTDKTLKVDYDEVSIKRIVYRSGENEYYLNGTRCRLKDITDLFLDSFSTKDGINIIAQGKVSELLSNRPEDRRGILEEAAGVLKYKKRKEESLRKLDKTHENLSRINMIINELETQVVPLEKESEKARRYIEIKEKLTSIDVALMAKDITSSFTNLESHKKKINALKESLSFKNAETSKEEAELEKYKLKLIKLEEDETKNRNELSLVSENLNELSNKKELLMERIKYDKGSAEVKNNLIKIKENEFKVKNEIDSLKRAIELKREEESELTEELKKLEVENNKLNTRLDVLRSEWNEKTKEEVSYKSKREILINNINNGELIPYSVKSVLNNKELVGINDIVANVIETDSNYEVMLNIALGVSANNVIVKDEASAKKAIKYLKDNKKGRATFLPINVMKPKSVEPTLLSKASSIPGFIDVASNLVTYDKMYYPVIMNLLGNIIVSKDIDSGTLISKEVNGRYRVVTLEGDVINVGGSMTGGSLKEKSGVIGEKHELERVEILLKNIEERKNSIRKEEEELEFSKNNIKDNIYKKNIDLVNLKEFIWNKESLLNEDVKTHEKLKQEISDLSNKSQEKMDSELNSIMEEYYKLEDKKNSISTTLENTIKEIKDLKEVISEKEIFIKKSSQAEKGTIDEINKLEIDAAKFNMTLDNMLEKLNEEYNLTYEKAREMYELEIEESEARELVSEYKRDIKLMGNVNLQAIEDYERINKRYTFLTSQKEDLESSEANILEVIRNMDDIMIDKFATTFNKVNKEFNNVFKTLFGGGEAHLKLTDPSNVLETGIEIIAYPPGKKPGVISLLSGGEKTLTAISLLFAIMNLKNVPFVILDEVESALDEANVDRFGEYLSHYKGKTQLLIITHKKKTMEYVDLLYGITMEESGVSKLVSVKLEAIK